MWALVSSTSPKTLKPLSSQRSPRVRSCCAQTVGTCDPLRRTDTAVASLRLMALAKEQSRRASGYRSVVASRLRSPVMRAPRRHTPLKGAAAASPSPISRSAITSARMVRSVPHSAHLSGESSVRSPTRRSTNVPVAAASQTFLSESVRSLNFMASATYTNDYPNSAPFLVHATLDERRHDTAALDRLTCKTTLYRFTDSRERDDTSAANYTPFSFVVLQCRAFSYGLFGSS